MSNMAGIASLSINARTLLNVAGVMEVTGWQRRECGGSKSGDKCALILYEA